MEAASAVVHRGDVREGWKTPAEALNEQPLSLHKPVLRPPVESGQYMSQEFADPTATLGIRRSGTGVPDNAQAESFNAAVKVERVNPHRLPDPRTRPEDRTRYIEFRFNTRRFHSVLDYRTPRKPTTTTRTPTGQHELTTNQLSGRCEADHGSSVHPCHTARQWHSHPHHLHDPQQDPGRGIRRTQPDHHHAPEPKSRSIHHQKITTGSPNPPNSFGSLALASHQPSLSVAYPGRGRVECGEDMLANRSTAPGGGDAFRRYCRR